MRCSCEVLFPSASEWQPATLTDEHPNALGRPVVDLADGEPYGPDGVASIRLSASAGCPEKLFDAAVEAGFHVLGMLPRKVMEWFGVYRHHVDGDFCKLEEKYSTAEEAMERCAELNKAEREDSVSPWYYTTDIKDKADAFGVDLDAD